MRWGKPEIKEVPSEVLIDWLKENGQRELNTTMGIWFYERDFFNVPKLKKQLKELIR